MEYLYRLAKFSVDLLLVPFDVFLYEYGQHKAQLLIDSILFIFSFSLQPEKSRKFSLCNLDLFFSSNEYDVSQIIRQVQERMSEVLPNSLVLFDSYLAWIHKRLDFFDIGHYKVAVYLLDQNGFHFDGLQPLK